MRNASSVSEGLLLSRISGRRAAARGAVVVGVVAVGALLAVAAAAHARAVAPAAAGDWTLPGRTPQGTRYSPLKQITQKNVNDLHEVWSYTDSILDGHEGQPLVVNNMLYMVTPFPNRLYAFDLTQPGPHVKWRYDPPNDVRAIGKACCDDVNRGASYYDGRIIYNTLDGHIVAVDARTGKQAWMTKLATLDSGETMTMAPLVINGIAYTGNSGGEMGVRGWLAAVDGRTGKLLWKAYSTGPDSSVRLGTTFKPYYKFMQGKDLGISSYPPDKWQIGGGAAWTWVTYDPELNEIYYGTSNPSTWNPDQRPGDNLWGSTLFARDPKTGMGKWAYQFTPHDEWDYDGINESIPVDITINGHPKKVVVHFDRNGYAYTIDRTDGQVLVAQPFEKVNWSTGVDLQSGRPTLVADKETHQDTITKGICPSSTGARDQQPAAYSPQMHLFFSPGTKVCMDYGGIETKYIASTPYVGAAVRMFAQDGNMGNRGEFFAWDPATGKKVWADEEKYPVWSGALATAGNVVFYGTMDGDFKAVDATNGKELWKTHFDSGVIGNPITFLGPDGKQYVAVYSGVGGWLGAIVPGHLSKDDHWAALGAVGAMYDLPDNTKPGGAVHVFALGTSGGNASGTASATGSTGQSGR